jgi:hypothetical protein
MILSIISLITSIALGIVYALENDPAVVLLIMAILCGLWGLTCVCGSYAAIRNVRLPSASRPQARKSADFV